MTQAEIKAKEIVEMFKMPCFECDYDFKAKLCAIILCDEMIDMLSYDFGDNQLRANEYISFWQEIKRILETEL